MPSRQVPAPMPGARLPGLAITAAGLCLLAMVSGQLASLTRATWRAVLLPGPATLDQAGAAVGASAALVLAVWLSAGILVSLLAALAAPTEAGRRSAIAAGLARCACWITPMIVRNAVAGLLGVAIIAVPAGAQAATVQLARGGPISHSAPISGSAAAAQAAAIRAAVAPLSPAWAPMRTDGAVPAAGTPAPSRTAGASDLAPGWVPDRPLPTRPRAGTGRADPARILAAPRRARAAANHDDEVVVRRGDTLWGLAARHLGADASDAEIATEWPNWFTANQAVIGPDPDRLQPGERLRVPGHSSGHEARHGSGHEARRAAGSSRGVGQEVDR